VARSEAGKIAERGELLATVDNTSIHSPAREVLTRYLVDSGQRVAAGDALLALARVQRVRVRAQVPLKDSALLSLGQTVVVVDGEGLIEGRLVEMQATSEGETFWVEAEVDNQRPTITHMAMNDLPQAAVKPADEGGRPGRLSLGQRVQLRYLSDRRNSVLTVPFSAIDEQEGKNYLYVVRDLAGLQVCQRRRVSLGIRNQTHVEVVSGLAEGETIAALSQEPLRDGSLVMTGEWGRGLFRNLLLPDDLGPSH
jgi:multidrug efflux pump subunit AcrA (membrane-fusion protein)